VYPVTITGQRINLREFRAEDLDSSMAIVGDPEVTESLSFDTRDRSDQAKRLASDIARAQSDPRPDYYLAVADSDDILVGFVRLGLGGHNSAELGYAVRRRDWGKGYATEAAALMLDFGFQTLHLASAHPCVGGPPSVGGWRHDRQPSQVGKVGCWRKLHRGRARRLVRGRSPDRDSANLIALLGRIRHQDTVGLVNLTICGNAFHD